MIDARRGGGSRRLVRLWQSLLPYRERDPIVLGIPRGFTRLRREKAFRWDRPPPQVEGKTAILVDDGLATGYTMIAAVRAVRKREPRAVIVAVPVSPRSSAEEVARDADEVIALHISDDYPFAVASFYREFPDMGDEEVRSCLDRG